MPVFEAVVGLLDPVGGHLAINLAAAAGAATVVGIAPWWRAWGYANGDLIALAFLAAPGTVTAPRRRATSSGRWHSSCGRRCHLHDRSVPGRCAVRAGARDRLSSVFLVAATLVADGRDRLRRRACLRTGLVALPLGALLYVPAWLAYDRSAEILDTAEGWRSFTNNLGRFAYKNYAHRRGAVPRRRAGGRAGVVAALRRWGHDPMLRTGVLGFAVSQALFFVLPWKYNHLLPCLAMFLLWLGASRPQPARVPCG